MTAPLTIGTNNAKGWSRPAGRRAWPPFAHRKSSGFTLVELLVVIALLMIIMALGVAILPGLSDGQYTTRGATQLQQWLEIAKQRAARDRAARGVRLWPAQDGTFQITKLSYLEQPDPYYLGSDATGKPSVAVVNGASVTFTNASVTLTGGFQDPTIWPVRPGDYIELAGLVYRIASVNGATSLTLTTSAPTAISTTNYRITRQPRPISDEPMDMPVSLAIDLRPPGITMGKWNLVTAPGQPVDIMFAPDGRVLGGLSANDKIILWVRNVTLPLDQGDPTLIVVFPATGLIAGHPVDIANLATNPFSFVSTGKRSSD